MPGGATPLPVQRVRGRGDRSGRATSAPATRTEVTRGGAPVADTAAGPGAPPPAPPPPGSAPPGGRPGPSAGSGPAAAGRGEEPPGCAPVPAGGLDPVQLTDFQLDELVHRIIGRVTRLVRTELRMDRERIGRLRDPR